MAVDAAAGAADQAERLAAEAGLSPEDAVQALQDLSASHATPAAHATSPQLADEQQQYAQVGLFDRLPCGLSDRLAGS